MGIGWSSMLVSVLYRWGCCSERTLFADCYRLCIGSRIGLGIGRFPDVYRLSIVIGVQIEAFVYRCCIGLRIG